VNDASEMPLYARLLLWLPKTTMADKAEIPLRTPEERLLWDKLSAENELCTSDACRENRCPRWVMQRMAENSHIIIVNHALLLSDLANEGHILPDFFDLIVDEAHHLEAAVTDGLSFSADKRSMERAIGEVVRQKSGLLDELTGRTNIVPPAAREGLDTLVNRLRQAAELAERRVADFFQTVHYFLQEYSQGGGRFVEQIRLTTAVRTQPLWDEVILSWDNLQKPLHDMVRLLGKISEEATKLAEATTIDDLELSLQNVLTTQKALEEMRVNTDNIIASPDNEYIYWAELFKDRLSLHAAPLHVGPLVEEYIFHAKETVILTSATMRTAPAFGDESPTFNYIRQRLHAHDAAELALGSPFDYKANSLLYLVSDIPEPNQPGYQRVVEQVIIDTAVALGGRTLVLFTAHAQLQQTAQAIRQPLRQAGIATLAQLQGSSRQQLTAQFKHPNARAVLLGTRSFWEGVDVPGEALQAVILVKIPFDVPSDPIFAARSETFDNSFSDYSIPEAILKWRQGFGRLIRSTTDEGVVLVLDKRVMSKKYGHAFTDSLPEATIIRQPASRVPELLARWFNRDRKR
jgi:ATP-dependent DNA helicase DinG